MQKPIIIVLAVTTLGLSALCLFQRHELRSAEARAAAVESNLAAERQTREAQESQLRELQATQQRLADQVQQFTKVTTNLREKDATQSSNLTAMAQALQTGKSGTGEGKSGALGKDMGSMLQTMLKDPAMRDMLRSQQKTVINQMYAGLFKDMNLSPEVKEKLTGILTESQMRNMEAAQGMFGKDAPADAVAELQKKSEEAKQQTESEIRSLLGDEGFAKYQDYQKTVGERMQIDQLKTNLEAANLPLQDNQSAQLLQIMQEEKAAVPSIFPTDNSQVPANMKELMTKEKIDQQLQWMDDYNKRVADRAKGFLTPDQFKRYQEFQNQQASMQRLGLKMASEMFGKSPDQKP